MSFLVVLGIHLPFYLIKQKHEVDGTETNEPVGFIDVYQVKTKEEIIYTILL